ncbi:MAG: CoA transferase [Microbacteriaceae bacterium]|nr:CoA transferase [Microbacteriaceae bacterium]
MVKPLDGLKILDLSRHMSGPYASALLTDYGAQVIKVESAGSGDPSRQTGSAMQGDQNALYLMWNRGKRSIALDLRKPEGVEAVRKLAMESDVFLENYRPGVAEKIGLGYETLHKLNPRLIYISVSGFGEGMLEDWPATDPVVQAMSGVMSLTGELGGPPLLIGVPIADFAGAMQAIQAMLIGVLAREKTGEGQHIEVSMMQALMASLTTRLAMYWATGEEPQRLGGSHSAVAPYNVFATKDGYMVAGVWGAGENWPKFCAAIDRPDLVEDPRFINNVERVKHRDILNPLIESITVTRTTAEWETLFRAQHVLFGPVLSLKELMVHPHVLQKGMVKKIMHPTAGEISMLAPTLLLSDTPGEIAGPPPRLGEHTEAILAEVGYSSESIAALVSSGVAEVAPPAPPAGS